MKTTTGTRLAISLGEVLTLQRGFDLPNQERRPGTIPVVSSSGITGTHDSFKVLGPGVVTGRYGTLGEVFYVRDDFWPLNTTLFVKDYKGNDPFFIYYLLRGLDFAAYNDKSSVPGINRNHLHTMPVRIPGDVGEQRAIAHILGTLDAKIEINRRTNRTLEAIARALFTSWFVAFDPVRANAAGRQPAGMDAATAALFPSEFEKPGSVARPSGWNLGSILQVASLRSGGTPKTDRPHYWNGDIPWASAKDISQCQDALLVDTERTITATGLRESATQLIDPFSTVVVARGATTGRLAMIGHEMAMNQTCYGIGVDF